MERKGKETIMESKTKKTLRSILVACVMAASMLLTPIIAAGADPLPPDKGDLTIEKYLEDGTTPIDGIRFDLYKVDTSNGMPPVGSGIVYRLNGSSMEAYSSANVLLGSFPVAAASPSYMTTAGGGIAKWTNLDQGLYLAIENLVASSPTVSGQAVTISSAHVPFLVAVPMTNSTGDGWITDVIVHPKNQSLSVEKTVDINTVNAVAVGDKLTYTIEATVPSDIATGLKYDIVDQLDSALTLDQSSVKVIALPGNNQLTSGMYGVTYISNKLVVAINSTGRTYLDSIGATKVRVTFDTTVNANILLKPDYGVANNAELDFTNKDGSEYTPDTGGGGPVVHTAAIQVNKVKQDESALNGATFRIATSPQKAANGEFLKIDANGVILESTDAGYAAANFLELTTDINGVAKFVGLRDFKGGTAQTYYIVETVAPAGYNLLDRPVAVTFDGTEANHTAVVKVINTSSFILPSTGGTGTMAFSVAGVVLLGIALALSLGKKSNKKDIA